MMKKLSLHLNDEKPVSFTIPTYSNKTFVELHTYIYYLCISDSTEEREIMETCYIYVTSDPYFHTLWSWQSMIDILPNLSCKKAKWFAIETISELTSIGQLGKKDLLRKLNDKSAEGDLIEKWHI